MRAVLFFDLPVVKDEDRKAANKFRRKLIKMGFYMLQESVYVKMNIDTYHSDQAIARVNTIIPSNGSIMVLNVTEKQFQNMAILLGDKKSDVIDSDDRLIEL